MLSPFSLACSELKGNRKFVYSFILNLAIGLVGLIVLDQYKRLTSTEVSIKSKELMGADFLVVSRLEVPKSTQKRVENIIPETKQKTIKQTFFTMVDFGEDLHLTQISVVEENYPLYGNFIFENKTFDFSRIHNEKVVVLSSEIREQFQMSVGDIIELGESEFLVGGFIEEEPTGGVNAVSFAPKIYMSKKHLKETELVTRGSTSRYHYLYRCVSCELGKSEISQMKKVLDNPSTKILGHQSANEQTSRLYKYLSDYLSLCSLVALILSGVGLIYIFHSYLLRQRISLGVLKSLGADYYFCLKYLVWQVVILGLIGTTLSVLVSMLCFMVIRTIGGIGGLVVPGVFHLSGSFLAILLGVILSLAWCMPLITSFLSEKSSSLFQSETLKSPKKRISSFTLSYIPLFLIVTALAIWQSNSWVVGSVFIAVSALLFVFLYCCGVIASRLIELLAEYVNGPLRWSLLSLSRKRSRFIATLISLTFSVSFINLIPQIRQNILSEVKSKGGISKDLPSYFLFDMQKEDYDDLSKMANQHQLSMGVFAPMIQGRLLKIRDIGVENIENEEFSREGQSASWARNRTYNFSYYSQLKKSEKIIEGEWFQGVYSGSGDIEISLERRFAKRLGVHVGDSLQFLIMDKKINVVITSIRHIQWTSFDPNFFVVFQPGVLEGFPSQYLGSIKGTSDSEKVFRKNFYKRFVGGALLDVKKVVSRLIALVTQLEKIILAVGLLCLLSGFAVLIAIAYSKIYGDMKQMQLSKCIGMSFRQIRMQQIFEFGITGLLAVMVGSMSSILISFGISRIMIRNIFSVELQLLVFLSASVVFIAIFIGWWVSGRFLKQSKNANHLFD